MPVEYVGIDLGCTAAARRPNSALAVLDEAGRLTEEPREFRRAAELVELLARHPRDRVIVAVDAPRTLPDWRRENFARRSCETEAQRAVGGHVGSFSGAAALYLRWHQIERAHLAGVKVIETYPRVVWRQLGVPGVPKDYRKSPGPICRAVEGCTGIRCDGFSAHQLDAVLSAYTARCYGHGRVRWFGRPGEGLLIVPDPQAAGGQRPTEHEERIDPLYWHITPS